MIGAPIFVFNAGSSSLKFAAYLLDEHAASTEVLWRSTTESPTGGVPEALSALRQRFPQAPLAIGHRIVHGGPDHFAPTRVDATLLAGLEAMVPLAPLHQSRGLAVIREVAAALPGVTQVACFDTAFHRRQPAVAQSYALPAKLLALDLRRYGFHGLSCEHVVDTLRSMAPVAAQGRVLIAHLGAGASLTAVRDGGSVASTMGLTPLDGVPMATRSGALDPGVLLYLLRHGFSVDSLEHLLYHESGLLGLSGSSGDVRALLASEASDPAAAFALEYFVYRCVREAGSLVAALGGLDALVFTGGIGEHQPSIRARIAAGLAWLGLEIDPAANARGATLLSPAGAAIACLRIPADEERVIARGAASLAVAA